MFTLSEFKLHEELLDLPAMTNWPMVYILENGREAYVGQSMNINKRMEQHRDSEQKKDLDTVHTIFSDEFNLSVTLDYEARLIRLIAADEQVKIRNKNAGIANRNYYQKDYYDQQFAELWEKLRQENVVRHTITEIVNSDLFKYSPFKELTASQRDAARNILDRLKAGTDQSILVSGVPGTGKTILCVFLFKLFRELEEYKNKKIALVIPQTSLRSTIKQLFRNIYGLKASDVIGPSEVVKDHYDILLVDEAHRLHRRKNITSYWKHDEINQTLGLAKDGDEMDWILKSSSVQIMFYDPKQLIGPSGISYDLLTGKIQHRMLSYFNLMQQMRVEGGEDYIAYVRNILEGTQKEKKKFDRYELYLVDKFRDFDRLMYEKEEEYGLSRMIAGFAWPWKSRKQKDEYDIVIENNSKRWNKRAQNWVNMEGAVDEVGCIHSIQGYDLNFAFVILGRDIRYDREKNQIYISRKDYFDQNGKNTATEAELLEYIRNIYYVLLTRGIKGTYLYICDEGLREYFKNFVEVL
ncbi:DNA/RNA helicase domain-containing protein [Anaerolentibacter hominis]|uniref:DNA/RNA helicase domain-containing protein n=1 Tax=Anaerolentibacter hominis TaxID=3079009 RepID=UPI0031B85CE9